MLNELYILQTMGDAVDETDDPNEITSIDFFKSKEVLIQVLESMCETIDEEDDCVLVYILDLENLTTKLIWGFWGWHWNHNVDLPQGFGYRILSEEFFLNLYGELK